MQHNCRANISPTFITTVRKLVETSVSSTRLHETVTHLYWFGALESEVWTNPTDDTDMDFSRKNAEQGWMLVSPEHTFSLRVLLQQWQFQDSCRIVEEEGTLLSKRWLPAGLRGLDPRLV